MEVDPAASMRCWAVEITLGGRDYEVPALPAVDWWPVISSGDLTAILDLVVSSPDDPFNLDDLLLSGSVDAAELPAALTDALEAVTGRSLHVCIVLASVASMHWASINGALVRRGFRWDVQPIGAALDAIYAEVTGRLEKEDLDRFNDLLENETITQPGKKRTPSQRVISEFEAMAGPRPKPGPVASAGPSDGERPRTPTPPRPRHPGGPSRVPRKPPGVLGRSGPVANPGSLSAGVAPTSA